MQQCTEFSGVFDADTSSPGNRATAPRINPATLHPARGALKLPPGGFLVTCIGTILALLCNELSPPPMRGNAMPAPVESQKSQPTERSLLSASVTAATQVAGRSAGLRQKTSLSPADPARYC